MNEPLDELGFGSRAAESVPETFPGFVRFPAKTLIEQVDRIKPLGISGEESGKGPAPGSRISRQAREHAR